jgi:hypothetical protein
MLDRVFANHDMVRRRSECLGPHLDSFAAHLVQCGYAAGSVRSRVALLGHFDLWLARHRCVIEELNDERVDTFLTHWKRRGRLHRGDATTLHQLLTHLRAQGVVASPAPVVDASPQGQVQRDYERYLRVERGLAPATVTDYCRVLRWFLTDRFGDGPLDLQELDVSTITTFVIRRASTMSPSLCKEPRDGVALHLPIPVAARRHRSQPRRRCPVRAGLALGDDPEISRSQGGRARPPGL